MNASGVYMKVWMLIAIAYTSPVYSSEFTRIKLNPEFEKYLTQPEAKSNLPKTGTIKTSSKITPTENPFETKMMGALLGSTPTIKSSITTPIPVDGETSPLYEEIRRSLETSHQQLGIEQVQTINRFNQQFNLGTSNFSGFSWQKPFGAVQIKADRQVTPNIFGSNWLVMDSFTFEINATTFLEKLAEAGLSGMSGTEIGAFAGITFRRVYTNWHYANSYQDGLQADFSKLYLPFVKFNQKGMESMGNEEVMKREDIWTSSVGGLITTPPLYSMSFSAGVLAEYDFQSMTSIQSSTTPADRFKVGVSNKKTAKAGVTAELQLDFFKLIKFSLLRYDMNYEYSSEKEFTLGFNTNHWAKLKEETEEGSELRSILRGFGTIKKLEPYVVRLDESSSSAFEQRGSVLIWGKMQKQKTEQVRVIKDNNVRVFYKNYSQNVKIVQNLLSRLFSAVVYKILKFPVGTNNAAIYSRQLTMEYEATHPQSHDPNIARIDQAEQFSFVLTQYYNAARTDRWTDKKYKNDVIWFIDNFTTLPKNFKDDVKNETLKGPLLVESNLRVEKAGFKYLLENSADNVFGHLATVCGSSNKEKWMNETARQAMLQKNQKGSDDCVQDLGEKYLTFKSDYTQNHLKPSLAKFKEFITSFYKKAGNILDLEELFGPENTFINGRLQAQTGLGMEFNTTFSSGQFRGLGVIDNSKREQGTRATASIPSDEI